MTVLFETAKEINRDEDVEVYASGTGRYSVILLYRHGHPKVSGRNMLAELYAESPAELVKVTSQYVSETLPLVSPALVREAMQSYGQLALDNPFWTVTVMVTRDGLPDLYDYLAEEIPA